MSVLPIAIGMPLKTHSSVIVSLMRAMLADFPSQYRKSYPDEKAAKRLKERLESKLFDFHPEDVIDGYEICIDENPKFIPAIPELVGHIKNLGKIRNKKIEGNLEAERIAALPKPTIQCNPVEMLAKAKVDAKNVNFKSETKKDREERLRKKEGLRLALQSSVAGIGRRYAKTHQECGVDGCRQSGAMTSSTSGSENWYCSKHFSMT